MTRKPSQSAAQRAVMMLIRAVGRLYKSHPPVRRMTFRRKDRVFERSEPTWYREPWMDDILQAYAKLKIARRLKGRERG